MTNISWLRAGGRGPVRGRLRRARYTLRNVASGYPSAYLPIAGRKHGANVVRPDTELVIDGFPRSANTFSVFAFQLSQPEPVRVAHHVHAPAQLIAAARWNVPTLVPVREPDGAIVSGLIREPHVGMDQALATYTRFYRRILPYRPMFVVATFEEIVQDFGAVVRRLNDRFGTRFSEFEHNERNLAECFELIEERARRPAWEALIGRLLSGEISAQEFRTVLPVARERAEPTAPIPETHVARPSASRGELKDECLARLRAPERAERRARAVAAFDAFVRGGR